VVSVHNGIAACRVSNTRLTEGRFTIGAVTANVPGAMNDITAVRSKSGYEGKRIGELRPGAIMALTTSSLFDVDGRLGCEDIVVLGF
jgi:hypothetical protein